MNPNYYVVIMAGGIGSRFWPFSRTNFPKQFHDVLGTGKTMIQQTADRYRNICPKENILVVTNKDYAELVKAQLPWMTDDQILLEPMGRNTAPCVAYAASKIFAKNPDANLVVCPADHVILMEETFERVILEALQATKENNRLLTLGMKPTRPDTGYGYIQFHEIADPVKKVKTFTEKPELEIARKFLESGDFVWNAGIFIWNAKAILQALEKYQPELYELFHDGNQHWWKETEQAYINTTYPQCKNISVDTGIMEKADNVYVMLADFGWSDLGTWKSLYELSTKDENGNVINANAMLYDTYNSVIRVGKDKLVVLEGVDNLIVAEADGVIMICHKDHEQRVKDFVSDAKQSQTNRKFI
jgi:mannose-1-phosphate guanylyltransferase